MLTGQCDGDSLLLLNHNHGIQTQFHGRWKYLLL